MEVRMGIAADRHTYDFTREERRKQKKIDRIPGQAPGIVFLAKDDDPF